MSRYFLELAYRGTRFSGFQIQENATTVQSEVEKAFAILHRQPVIMTGSSRTDAGVHALQNYFHFDFPGAVHEQFLYKMNAILPSDIVIRNLYRMPAEAHSRFDALSRAYEYRVHRVKNPFREGLSLFYPYKLDLAAMSEAANSVLEQEDFFAFAKTNTQVKNFRCRITLSRWHVQQDELMYEIEGNRFLRGMVRLLTASQLRVGRGKMSLEEFKSLFGGRKKSGVSVPAQGLFLKAVRYPENFFPASDAAFTGF